MLELDVEGEAGALAISAALTAGAGVTALIGPSGAGKTTLLRMIAGLARPATGHIRLDGHALFDAAAGVDVPAHRRRIGMVFQEPRLLPHRPVAANIALGLRGGPHKRVREAAERLHISALLNRRTGGLSGGEQQRVMLARALVGEPDLIVCDEPLTGLDLPLRSALLDQMRAAFRQSGVPVLYVTHSVDEAARLAQTTHVMTEGRIADSGDTAAVLARLDSEEFYETGVTSVLSGTVVAVDADYGLATIAIAEQSVEVPAGTLREGEVATLRLWAKDVILARGKPEGLSARNALAGTIASIADRNAAQAEVTVMVGTTPVRTRVMRKTVAELGFAPGETAHVVFKSAAVE